MKKIKFKWKFLICLVWFMSVYLTVKLGFDPIIHRTYGISMWPNISSGDYVISIGKGHEIKRGNVVVFRADNLTLVKRVIGLPGDIIIISGGKVYVNAIKEETEDLVLDKTDVIGEPFYADLLSDNEYFMLGDNRPLSYDSRYLGPIKKENIIGKVVVRWSPLNPSRYLPWEKK